MSDPTERVPAAIAEAAATLGVLADVGRFKVLSAIALGAQEVADIVTTSGVDRRDVEKALARLVAADLIIQDEGVWRIRFDELQSQARAAAAERAAAEPDPDSPESIRRFFKGPRLVSIPANHSKRVAVLDHIAQQFEPGYTYTEREISAALAQIHEDYASLRRYLIDEGFLERSEGKYWRSGGTFNVD